MNQQLENLRRLDRRIQHLHEQLSIAMEELQNLIWELEPSAKDKDQLPLDITPSA